jgi:hypothetical protein
VRKLEASDSNAGTLLQMNKFAMTLYMRKIINYPVYNKETGAGVAQSV